MIFSMRMAASRRARIGQNSSSGHLNVFGIPNSEKKKSLASRPGCSWFNNPTGTAPVPIAAARRAHILPEIEDVRAEMRHSEGG